MHDIDIQLASMLRGDFETGWKISEKLEKIGPDNIAHNDGKKDPELWLRHQFNRGWFLLQQGKYQEGSQTLEAGRYLSVYGSSPLRTSAPIYNPQQHDIKGKSLIISLEGGYGDEIIHARYAKSFKDLGASKVYLAAAPEVVSIFSRIPGVDGVILRDQANTIQHDFWVPGFSAGWLAGHDYSTLPSDPYLFALPDSIQLWQSVIKSDKKKVGIRWSGNPKFEHQQFRRFPPEFMINLAKYDDIQLYSLQRDHNLQALPENIVDLQHLLISWEDTLAAMMNLDLIITSCTSIAHAAAALGKETWVFTPVLPYHTWSFNAPYSTTSPYYKTAKIYRQLKPDGWNDIFQRMYKDLEDKFDLTHVDLPSCDKELKRANLGCGYKKVEGFDNIDISPRCRPDKIVDLNSKNWDIPDDSYDHIVAQDVLEHLDDFTNAVKEMYRISTHGAIWEIQVPHWNCDIAKDDPTHKRAITPGTFRLFDMKRCLDNISAGRAESTLAIDANIDIEVCETKIEMTEQSKERFAQNNATQEEIDFSINHLNNVALSTMILIQVHKPPRYNDNDIEKVIDAYYEKSNRTQEG